MDVEVWYECEFTPGGYTVVRRVVGTGGMVSSVSFISREDDVFCGLSQMARLAAVVLDDAMGSGHTEEAIRFCHNFKWRLLARGDGESRAIRISRAETLCFVEDYRRAALGC